MGKGLVMDKRGWIRLVEVFVAILLISGVAIIIIDQSSSGKEDFTSKVYETQVILLHHVFLDDGDRIDILAENEAEMQTKINNRKPDYLSCDVEICNIIESCESLEIPSDKDIFAQYIIIEEPPIEAKKIKLFCWLN